MAWQSEAHKCTRAHKSTDHAHGMHTKAQKSTKECTLRPTQAQKIEHRITEMEQLSQISIRDLLEAEEGAKTAGGKARAAIEYFELIKNELHELRRIIWGKQTHKTKQGSKGGQE